ncbi:hypothetical protein [Bradyrhizobium sp. DOA9]|uniref:hypothetical protein n=1 Tax=Bradyrhizobium sp. DOA9 TaxID=1126627 RepID=UPI001260173B|nr:hypothetical protein [Bradyrhizobium sp. DOA9]
MQIALQEVPDISRPWRWLEVNPADPIRLDALEAADDFAPRRSSHESWSGISPILAVRPNRPFIYGIKLPHSSEAVWLFAGTFPATCD